MTIWVCIPVHNRIAMTLACLRTLADQTYADFRVVICDDGSTDETSSRIAECFPDVTVLPGDGGLWWTGGINRCVEYVREHAVADDYVLTLNNDLELPADYLYELAEAAKHHPRSLIGSVCADIATHEPTTVGFRHSWLTSRSRAVDPDTDHLPDDPTIVPVTHLPGRGTMIPLAAFSTIGFYDELHLRHYGADYDFTFRASRAGYGIYVCLKAIVYSHVEETGITSIWGNISWRSFARYLTDIKSPANLKARWWVAYNSCPKLWLPVYLVLDFGLIVASYFRIGVRQRHAMAAGRKEAK